MAFYLFFGGTGALIGKIACPTTFWQGLLLLFFSLFVSIFVAFFFFFFSYSDSNSDSDVEGW